MNTEQIDQRLADIEATTRPLLDEAARLRQKKLEMQTHIRVGDVIQWRFGSSNQKIARGRVLDIVEWVGKPAFRVRVIRENGSEGTVREINPYNAPELAVNSN